MTHCNRHFPRRIFWRPKYSEEKRPSGGTEPSHLIGLSKGKKRSQNENIKSRSSLDDIACSQVLKLLVKTVPIQRCIVKMAQKLAFSLANLTQNHKSNQRWIKNRSKKILTWPIKSESMDCRKKENSNSNWPKMLKRIMHICVLITLLRYKMRSVGIYKMGWKRKSGKVVGRMPSPDKIPLLLTAPHPRPLFTSCIFNKTY